MKKFLFSLTLTAAMAIGAINARAQAAAATNTPPPAPSLEQRISSLEAYVNNGDPTAGLKDKDGKIADGLTTPTVGVPGPGANAWQMTSAALVLFMTLPGLALFYGGLVRRKNILSVMAQCFFITGMVTILWWICGYSLVFHSGETASGWSFLGNLKFAFLKDVGSVPNTDYSYWVSHNVFSMYQLMFAIITPALILGDLPVHGALDVHRLFPAGAHDLGH